MKGGSQHRFRQRESGMTHSREGRRGERWKQWWGNREAWRRHSLDDPTSAAVSEMVSLTTGGVRGLMCVEAMAAGARVHEEQGKGKKWTQ